MREAAHDLRNRAAVDAEVEGSPRLAPSLHHDGMEDVTGGEMIAGKLGHDGSLSPHRRIEGTGLNEATKDATLWLLGHRL